MEPIKKLRIRVGAEKRALSINRLVGVLSGMQNTIFSIGDYLQNNKVRQSGDYPESIRETCELKITNVSNGSAIIDLEVSKPEQTKLEENSLGERSLGIFAGMSSHIGTKKYGEAIEKQISDPFSRRLILQRFKEVIPTNPTDFVEITRDSTQLGNLKSVDRAKIDRVMPPVEDGGAKAVVGRLMELKASKQANFQIDTPSGIIRGKYSPKCLEFFRKNFNGLVQIKGEFKNANVLFVNERSFKEELKNYPLRGFKYEGKVCSLARPLEIDVAFEDGENIFSEKTFDLLVVGKDFKECSERIEEQFGLLWHEYAEKSDANFSPCAKELRKKLLSIVK